MQGRMMLLATVLAAVVATVATTVLLLPVDPTAPRSEAVRTGAISGGAVVALCALWLARLDHFRLGGGRIGRITARRARFHGITQLAQSQAATPALFTTAPAVQVGTLVTAERIRVDGVADGWAPQAAAP